MKAPESVLPSRTLGLARLWMRAQSQSHSVLSLGTRATSTVGNIGFIYSAPSHVTLSLLTKVRYASMAGEAGAGATNSSSEEK